VEGSPKKTKQTIRLLEALLERPTEEVHGFRLLERTGIKSGTLYPLLIRLEKLGWVTSRWEESDRPGPRRRFYRLSAEGEPAARKFLASRQTTRAHGPLAGVPTPSRGTLA